ncbi:2-isopropylmalate synthase/homocitrate synthase family protein [Thermaerobacter marianensis DSM 12885]|uniref:Citramalate synthase n=1 Tax=Thermaerobacter marianensis (strain ATCC 700841 / DSM 12885 / JCM 10246 / 7p75a) TaxID=644966 RepID=E6SMQ1_THEM7|nr:citramalate synthase [Thermaerobacter marianensis]ADU51543.1 2-isopropylmalate synthase/homocitrate synthase family protein [Thermaerobacter marianensis DSM 12885]
MGDGTAVRPPHRPDGGPAGDAQRLDGQARRAAAGAPGGPTGPAGRPAGEAGAGSTPLDVVLYDTTLRDGTQRAGIHLTLADKVRLARRLDAFGIPYVEGGWPGSNPKDAAFFRVLQDQPLERARLVAFTSTRRPGHAAHHDPVLAAALAAATPAVCVVGKAWDRHVTVALGTTLAENLAMVRETVAFLKEHGREVIFDAEHFFDGFAANPDYALAVLAAAEEAGADWLVLCDTNGGTLPGAIAQAVRAAAACTRVPLGIHCHDDAGLGVANSLAAVEAGCRMVQGTVNGYGERCGNANLLTIAANLELKMGRRCLPPGALAGLTALSRFTSEVANLPHREEAPYVGANAFAHKAGIHVSALLKEPALYEHVDPARVGNGRRVLVSELSGRANLRYVLGSDLDEPALARLLARVKELEHQGYQFEGAEGTLALLAWEARRAADSSGPAASGSTLPRSAGDPPEAPFVLESYRVTAAHEPGAGSRVEATIKVRVGGRVVHTAAEGNGPVNALDAALRKALSEVYPDVQQVRLVDYKVRVLEGDAGTGARVRVLVECTDGRRRWGTVGVSTNILEASWHALADGLRYYLLGLHASGLNAAAAAAGASGEARPDADAAGGPGPARTAASRVVG